MLTILASILVFGVLITVHELGHFLVAKLTGMKVDECAVGFGPLIYQNKTPETIYSLRLVPLGGYNKIAGMEADDGGDEAGKQHFTLNTPDFCAPAGFHFLFTGFMVYYSVF